jgi:signal transduction histidine kinase
VGTLSSGIARCAPGATGPGASRIFGSTLRRAARPLAARRLEAYVSVVTVLGISAVSFFALRDLSSPAAAGWLPPSVAITVLALFTLGSELVPIRIERRGDVEEVTTSTAFGFALVLIAGVAPAVYVLALASVLADVSRRKPARKVLFNMGQYAFITALAGGVFVLLGGTPGGHDVDLPAFVVAAVVFFCLNTLLTGIVVALAEGISIVDHVRSEFLFNAMVAATLLAMSPVVALVAHHSMALLIAFLLPVGAVQLAAKRSLERVALVEQLRGSLAHMTELNRAKDEFVAVVSHELRTPLTSVRGNIRTLLHLGAELSEADVRSCLEAADRQSERLQQQIERLLFVANIETRRERLGPTHPVSIADLVGGIVADLAPVLIEHRVVLHVDEDVRPVTTDEGSVTHIVMNLLENAAKYSEPGSEIDVDVRREGDGVILAVRDRGPGIAREHRDRIFDRFYQVDSSTTRSVGGTGLGLYIAAGCARDVGGRLWLERSDASGSQFCVQIPSVPAREDASAASRASEITAIASA